MSVLPKFKNLVEMAVSRAMGEEHKPLMTFMGDDGQREALLTFKGLDASARMIAAMLVSEGLRGSNVLLLYAPGLEYIKGFFGCLYAGAVPVPAYPPMGARDLERLANVAKDCDASAILSTASLTPMIQAWLSNPANGIQLPCFATDGVESKAIDACDPFDAEPDSVAFLQYTSGSTGHPKGVMVSHRNLFANFEQILGSFAENCSAEEISEQYRTVIWLPPFHDMGLIGGVLTPVYGGNSVTLMSPLTFLKNPFLWLKAISDDRALVSGGPNFSFQYCVRKISEEQKQQLDLSSWRVAFNGAESINADSLRSFSAKFAGCGFDARAFLPCYGLAESTLFVTGAPLGRGALVRDVALGNISANSLHAAEKSIVSDLLSDSAAVTKTSLVSSGKAADNVTLLIVDPNVRTPLEDGNVGEIWVSSPAVCSGYWKKPALSESVFRARVQERLQECPQGVDDRTFLRTGDLGFVWENELYVTGRIKELIIIAGRNHYPQDLEATVQDVAACMRKGCGAAFASKINGKEHVVVVQEINVPVNQPLNYVALVLDIVKAVSRRHGVGMSALVLLRAGTLPKTSSGKIQRTEARRLFENDQMEGLHRWSNVQKINVISNSRDNKRSVEIYTDWSTELYAEMQSWVAAKLNVEKHHINLDVTFSELGVDSIEAIEVIDRLQQQLGRTINATELLRYPTVKALLDHLAADMQSRHVVEPGLLHTESTVVVVKADIGKKFGHS